MIEILEILLAVRKLRLAGQTRPVFLFTNLNVIKKQKMVVSYFEASLMLV